MFRMLVRNFIQGIALLITSAAAFSLPNDSKERLYIVADTTVYNYKAGINTFEGHVKVDQGSTHIVADRLQSISSSGLPLQSLSCLLKQSGNLNRYYGLSCEHFQ